MNIRSLTRGDGVVIGAAVLLFIASLLDFYSADGVDLPSVWDTDVYHLALPSIFLAGFVAAGLIAGSRFLPQPRNLAGLPLQAWGSVLAVSAVWASLWSLITCPSTFDLGAGAVISFLSTLAMAGVAVAGPKIPALAGQLIPDPAPGAVPAYGAQPQPGTGYGYPGGQQPQAYGATPQPVAPYGGQAAPAPTPTPAPAAQDAAPAADFTPFWFAVPVARPLFAEDGSPTPIAELAPGTWYLAVEQRGEATLIAQTQDGRRGVLNDTSGIQRG
ncbi:MULTISPECIES: DUF5336 domain-containing protein [unclassified Streptomyces]|uniref:DUF5336 domain-containing protein n=1 Tax=unclassified Streptomyces TaxID=2593676 RepID=UPI001BE5A55C|nr:MULTISPECIES: DUF5336 domain-containing protein [unclassified Streptomyces]MBT2403569.1 hypothetical protein [Streptomyces sp. ISL-21]MBT2458403.1 hypothetical protein [Streptomyces sp. ISL-86]MBT2609954.1 hypothetical protein [Streptomyces sp. ISL-87]